MDASPQRAASRNGNISRAAALQQQATNAGITPYRVETSRFCFHRFRFACAHRKKHDRLVQMSTRSNVGSACWQISRVLCVLRINSATKYRASVARVCFRRACASPGLRISSRWHWISASWRKSKPYKRALDFCTSLQRTRFRRLAFLVVFSAYRHRLRRKTEGRLTRA